MLTQQLIMTTEKIYNAFYADYYKRKTFYHGHTYTANPISCSAALASLDIFRKENILNRIRGIIPLFHSGLKKFRELPFVGNVRYIGMIGAIELVKDKKTKQQFGFKERIGMKIYKKALKEGIILRPLGDVIYLYLPLCIKAHDLRIILKKMYKTVQKISQYVV